MGRNVHRFIHDCSIHECFHGPTIDQGLQDKRLCGLFVNGNHSTWSKMLENGQTETQYEGRRPKYNGKTQGGSTGKHHFYQPVLTPGDKKSPGCQLEERVPNLKPNEKEMDCGSQMVDVDDDIERDEQQLSAQSDYDVTDGDFVEAQNIVPEMNYRQNENVHCVDDDFETDHWQLSRGQNLSAQSNCNHGDVTSRDFEDVFDAQTIVPGQNYRHSAKDDIETDHWPLSSEPNLSVQSDCDATVQDFKNDFCAQNNQKMDYVEEDFERDHRQLSREQNLSAQRDYNFGAMMGVPIKQRNSGFLSATQNRGRGRGRGLHGHPAFFFEQKSPGKNRLQKKKKKTCAKGFSQANNPFRNQVHSYNGSVAFIQHDPAIDACFDLQEPPSFSSQYKDNETFNNVPQTVLQQHFENQTSAEPQEVYGFSEQNDMQRAYQNVSQNGDGYKYAKQNDHCHVFQNDSGDDLQDFRDQYDYLNDDPQYSIQQDFRDQQCDQNGHYHDRDHHMENVPQNGWRRMVKAVKQQRYGLQDVYEQDDQNNSDHQNGCRNMLKAVNRQSSGSMNVFQNSEKNHCQRAYQNGAGNLWAKFKNFQQNGAVQNVPQNGWRMHCPSTDATDDYETPYSGTDGFSREDMETALALQRELDADAEVAEWLHEQDIRPGSYRRRNPARQARYQPDEAFHQFHSNYQTKTDAELAEEMQLQEIIAHSRFTPERMRNRLSPTPAPPRQTYAVNRRLGRGVAATMQRLFERRQRSSPEFLNLCPRDWYGPEDLDLDDFEAVLALTEMVGDAKEAGLSKEKITTIPHFPVQAHHLANKELDDCKICWDDFAVGHVVTSLPCKHVFHEKCISKWLVNKPTCPLCREIV